MSSTKSPPPGTAAGATMRKGPLIGGALFSNVGDSILVVTFIAWITEVTGDPRLGAMASWLVLAPMVLGPVWGHLADRRSSRHWITLLCVLLAVCLTAGAVATSQSEHAVLLLALAGGYGLLAAMLDPAIRSSLPRLLGRDEDVLAQINGYVEGANQLLRIVAPLVGAGLYALVGGPASLLATAAVFVVAAAFFARLPRATAAPAERNALANIRDGIRVLQHHRPLRSTVLVALLAMGSIGALEPAALAYIFEDLGREAAWLGPVLALQGVGLLGGVLAAQPVVKKWSAEVAMGAGLAVTSLGLIAALPQVVPLAISALAVMGIGFGMFVIGYSVCLQRDVPEGQEGTVMGAAGSAIMVAQLLMASLAIAALGAVGARTILVAVIVLLAVTALVPLRRTPSSSGPSPTKHGLDN